MFTGIVEEVGTLRRLQVGERSATLDVAAGAVAGLLLRPKPAPQPEENPELAALGGRLAQMAESQNAVQSAIVERLQAQERVVIKAVDERLQGLSKQVGDRLTDSTTKHQTALADLRERMAVIDKAQQNLTEISTQMVGLQDILANKQARGAFGEIQLNDIVAQALPPSAYAMQDRPRRQCAAWRDPPSGRRH